MSEQMIVETEVFHGLESALPLNYAIERNGITIDPHVPNLSLHVNPFPETHRRQMLDRFNIARSLGEIAHYINERNPQFIPENIVGVTHIKVGRIAARLFGFHLITDAKESIFPLKLLEDFVEFKDPTPCIVVMSREEFLATYLSGSPAKAINESAHIHNLFDRIKLVDI